MATGRLAAVPGSDAGKVLKVFACGWGLYTRPEQMRDCPYCGEDRVKSEEPLEGADRAKLDQMNRAAVCSQASSVEKGYPETSARSDAPRIASEAQEQGMPDPYEMIKRYEEYREWELEMAEAEARRELARAEHQRWIAYQDRAAAEIEYVTAKKAVDHAESMVKSEQERSASLRKVLRDVE